MIALTSVDLLIIDDFALEPMTKEESKDVYQLFLERTGRASMIVTSNRDTAEWLAMFDDVLLAQSAVDRFRNAAYDFVMEGRVLSTQAQADARRCEPAACVTRHEDPRTPPRPRPVPLTLAPSPCETTSTRACSRRGMDIEQATRHSR
jgi:hypothetical protein